MTYVRNERKNSVCFDHKYHGKADCYNFFKWTLESTYLLTSMVVDALVILNPSLYSSRPSIDI